MSSSEKGIMRRALAIIAARGGSKRIPRKNIRPFVGQPIIRYSIAAAIGAGCFEEVMVSTDDQEIAAVAMAYGAKIPFLRSAERSNDYATTVDVIEEVLECYSRMENRFEYLCCIYPTAPFVTSEKIATCMRMLVEQDVDAVLPVVRFSYPIQRSLKIERDGFVRMVWPENYNMRSQDMNPTYHDSGQFYCMRTAALLAQKRLFAERTLPFELSELEVQDIDNEEDWRLAEAKYRVMKERRREG